MKNLFQVSAAVIAALVVGFASYYFGAHSRSESVPVGFTGSKQNMDFSKYHKSCAQNCDIHFRLIKDAPTGTSASCDTQYTDCILLNQNHVTGEPGTCLPDDCNYTANVVLEWKQD
jgi:hypothetical protein